MKAYRITHGEIVDQSYVIPGDYDSVKDAAAAIWDDLDIGDTVAVCDVSVDPTYTDPDYPDYTLVDYDKCIDHDTLMSGMWIVDANGEEDFKEKALYWESDPDTRI